MAACEQMFSITELLERALLHLPLKDLLLAQRVSKRWRDLIQDSTKIRRALFLQSTHDELVSHDSDTVYGADEVGTSWQTKSGINHSGMPIINPLVHHRERTDLRYANRSGCILPLTFLGCADEDGINSTSTKHSAEASWKSMSLLQPAISEIEFINNGDYMYYGVLIRVRNTQGVKMVDVVTELRAHWLKWKEYDSILGDVKMWEFLGDEGTTSVKLDITGWEILAEFAKQA